MGNLEKVDRAQLESALTTTEGRLQKRLPAAELKVLGTLLERTARRYPNQDLTLTLPEYLTDLEQLALRFSLQKVIDAVFALRIKADQDFFPTPSQVAAEIEQQRLRALPSHVYARG
jgi:hypothetical protein